MMKTIFKLNVAYISTGEQNKLSKYIQNEKTFSHDESDLEMNEWTSKRRNFLALRLPIRKLNLKKKS